MGGRQEPKLARTTSYNLGVWVFCFLVSASPAIIIIPNCYLVRQSRGTYLWPPIPLVTCLVHDTLNPFWHSFSDSVLITNPLISSSAASFPNEYQSRSNLGPRNLLHNDFPDSGVVAISLLPVSTKNPDQVLSLETSRRIPADPGCQDPTSPNDRLGQSNVEPMTATRQHRKDRTPEPPRPRRLVRAVGGNRRPQRDGHNHLQHRAPPQVHVEPLPRPDPRPPLAAQAEPDVGPAVQQDPKHLRVRRRAETRAQKQGHRHDAPRLRHRGGARAANVPSVIIPRTFSRSASDGPR